MQQWHFLERGWICQLVGHPGLAGEQSWGSPWTASGHCRTGGCWGCWNSPATILFFPLGNCHSILCIFNINHIISNRIRVLRLASSMGGLSSSSYASSRPPLMLVRWWNKGLLDSSMVTVTGSMMDMAVSSSAASEQENTSRLCRLQDTGRSEKLGLKLNTAVL